MSTRTNMQHGQRAVSNWILLGVIMLLIQVVLGGVTRLTGSGLSITEWDVVTGAIPPLNEQQWLEEFAKYRQTNQFKTLNTSFTLDDFKFIFFWEWFHRFWARLIGVAFIAGFVWLVGKRYLRAAMVKPLLILFLLGALQGAIGWIMVASGLTGDAIYVKPTRLALHFIFALLLVAYAFWFALQLRIPYYDRIRAPRLQSRTFWLIALLVVQLTYGALMAGHKAANAAATWPDINGSYFPAGLWVKDHGLLNLVDNPITIHFVHRNLAYLLLVLIVVYTLQVFRFKAGNRTLKRAAWWPLILVVVQVALGIFSLLTAQYIVPNQWGRFEWMAQLHQVTGMLLLLSLVAMLYLTRKPTYTQLS
jgi:cytochrome c oxidase assembly protein subunit 15